MTVIVILVSMFLFLFLFIFCWLAACVCESSVYVHVCPHHVQASSVYYMGRCHADWHVRKRIHLRSMASWRNHHILLTLWNSCEREWKRKRERHSSLNSNAICIENVYEKRRRRGSSSRSSIIRRGAKCSHTSVMNTCYDNNQCDRSINNNYFHFIFRCNAYKVWLVFFCFVWTSPHRHSHSYR